MATTKKIPSDSILLRFLKYGVNSDLIQSIPMTNKFADKLNKLQRKLEIQERDTKNPNEMKKLPMGNKRWEKHIETILVADRAKREAKDKKYNSTKLKHDEVYVYSASPNKKGGKIKTYSKGGGVRKPNITAGY
jgi:hypothetical protein|tara:strand:+ start:189 stop:590 length:402 start_codon:yes stop_codon:yes gene_type:complete